MKRLLLLTFTLMFSLVSGFPLPAFAQAPAKEIPVLVDGLPVAFDVKPVIQNQRTLVPFRAIAEALNVNVTWDGATKTLRATDGNTSIRLQIGNKIGYVNETPVKLEVPPVLLNQRTLIPLRFFSEAFNCEVLWDSSLNGARITSPPRAMTVIGFYALGDRATSSWTNLFGKAYPEADRGNTDIVGEVALGWYSLDELGNLLTKSKTGWQRPSDWEKVLETAQQYNLKTGMVIHLPDKDPTFAKLLGDETAMTRAISAIAEEARLYDGVNLDIEGLGPASREGFTGFVRLLYGQLQASGKNLTLTLHPPNSAYQGYDYQSLGGSADRIIIMAYDYGPKPEPVSQVTQAVEMAKPAVPPEKLVLGISAPSETPESMLTKVGIAKRHNLNSIALWRLGLITDGMWTGLKRTILPRN